jgi:hypothetical protein
MWMKVDGLFHRWQRTDLAGDRHGAAGLRRRGPVGRPGRFALVALGAVRAAAGSDMPHYEVAEVGHGPYRDH